jgi:hypothetical protein
MSNLVQLREEFVGISGAREGFHNCQMGDFFRPWQCERGEKLMRRVIAKKWKGERVLTIDAVRF